jgi:hypothetical protein
MLSAVIAAALIQTTLPGTNNPPSDQPRVSTVRAGDNIRNPRPEDEDADPQRVCRMEPVTGSRFPVRVCRGARNAAGQAADAREMLRQAQGLPELAPASAAPKAIPGL